MNASETKKRYRMLRAEKRREKSKIRNNSYARTSRRRRYCDRCGGYETWCTCCETWTRTCCEDYGTCMCS